MFIPCCLRGGGAEPDIAPVVGIGAELVEAWLRGHKVAVEDDGDVFEIRQYGLVRQVSVDGGVDVVVVDADILRDAACNEVVGVVIEVAGA